MARIAHCDFQVDGCNDGRCKIGACVLELEEERNLREMVATYLRDKATNEEIERTVQFVRDDPKYAAHVRNAAGIFNLADAVVDAAKRTRALYEAKE